MRTARFVRGALLAPILLAAALIATPQAAASDATEGPADLLLILDASGSMWGQIAGENKIVIARRVLGSLIDDLPADLEVGLIAYGHRREGDCADIESVVPLGPLDKDALKGTVDGLNPKGKTPITASVEQAFEVVRGTDRPATVILVSDGLETCGGDPCAAVEKGKEMGLDFRMHVVAFDIADDDVSQLECAAQAGDGLFLAAKDAEQLGDALDTVVAQAPEVPDGRLSVKAVTNGELQDVSVVVTDAATGEDMGGGRTYTDPSTNPRVVPLPAGTYHVKVEAVGIEGDTVRHFANVVIADQVVEKNVDFSTGAIAVGVTRNGARSDATVNVYVGSEAKRRVAGGRTYTGEKSNPKTFTLTAGTYDVVVGSVEIAGKPEHRWDSVVVPPGGTVEVAHEYQSGTLEIGAERSGTLVDATLNIVDTGSGKSVGAGRTYTAEKTNPKTFTLIPGTYRVTVSEIRGDKRTFEVTLAAGDETTRMVDFDTAE